MSAPQRAALATLLLTVAGLLGTAPAGAEIYKSVDKDGNVVFSETPPPGQAAEAINPRYARQPKGAGTAAATGQAAPETKPAATAAEAPTELTPEQKAAKSKNCANARGRLTELNGPRANRLQYVNAKNERAFYTPQELEAAIADATAAAKKYCD